MNIVNNLSRLRWACRRGMLELDVLLNNFLDNGYQNLSLPEKELFIQLLQQPDPELFSWLMGHEVPKDPDLLSIVEIIRNHARTRTNT